jgi:hypothetical protein
MQDRELTSDEVKQVLRKLRAADYDSVPTPPFPGPEFWEMVGNLGRGYREVMAALLERNAMLRGAADGRN